MSATNHPLHLTPESFEREVLAAPHPVLVDFWADWCGPCHQLAPSVAELAREFAGRATVAKLDVDAHPDLAREYGIRSIPSLLFFRNGEVVDRVTGTVPRAALAARLGDLV